MQWYNYKRKHGAIGMITPMQKWEQGWAWSAVKQQFEPDSLNLSRPDKGGLWEESASYSLDKFRETAYLRLTGDQENEENFNLVANLFENNVQLIGG